MSLTASLGITFCPYPDCAIADFIAYTGFIADTDCDID
jgi:hypothetical protein